MGKELDRRDFSKSRASEGQKLRADATAASVSALLPGNQAVTAGALDPVSGNTALVAAVAAPAEKGNYVERALTYLNRVHRVMGLAATQPPEFSPDHHVQSTSSGASVVHFQQRYKGIPIYQANIAVRFAPNGSVLESVGSPVTVDGEIPVQPRLSAEQAVAAAISHCGAPDPDEEGRRDPYGQVHRPREWREVRDYQPKVVGRFAETAEQQVVFEAGPFAEPIKANLIWFDLGEDLRLAWHVVLTMPEATAQYRTIVDAENGEILFCHQLIQEVMAKANICFPDGSARRTVDFPLALADFGLSIPSDLPAGFPEHWVSGNETAGNLVRAHTDVSGPTVTGSIVNGTLTFDAAPQDEAQRVITLFYLNCFMHDFLYMLGFREEDGNFQQDNLGRGGAGSDRVDAQVHAGEVDGTATMRSTHSDGRAPVMNMGIVSVTGRHSALDSSVVFHEYMHGVTNRLVGGPLDLMALDMPQSAGMGEGWGDYIACTINDTTVVGSWLVDRAAGIREFPYDSNFPDHFGKIGKGRFDEVHNIGEIWCATLMEMNRKVGKALALQLVVDALKLSPANPSFLDMRDAIIQALEMKLAAGQITSERHAVAMQGIRDAFGKFGMGPGARSNGASLEGIQADFSTPAASPVSSVRGEANPNLAIPDNLPTGLASTIRITDARRVKRINVSVDIAHSFIGDLRVILRSPSGTEAVLHDRTGASARDLVASFTSEGLPELQAFTGETIQGDWTLSVVDTAPADEGTLRKWGLEIGIDTAEQTVEEETAPGRSIPDSDPAGISSAISVSATGSARKIAVGVDISHTFIGDLRVELTSPGGQTAVLHDKTGGNAQNLITTFDSSAGALAALLNQPITGVWRLTVRDLAAGDVGKLNRWTLQINPGAALGMTAGSNT